jgi:hypothetical protein
MSILKFAGSFHSLQPAITDSTFLDCIACLTRNPTSTLVMIDPRITPTPAAVSPVMRSTSPCPSGKESFRDRSWLCLSTKSRLAPNETDPAPANEDLLTTAADYTSLMLLMLILVLTLVLVLVEI